VSAAVGILALQGDFDKHSQVVARVGATPRRVLLSFDLDGLDALVVPGGESTTMRHMIAQSDMEEPLSEFARTHPVMGTCAGFILMAKMLDGAPNDSPLAVLDVSVARNAYGRQVHSFVSEGRINFGESERTAQMIFIRAPRVVAVGDGCRPCGWHEEEIVMVRAVSGPTHLGAAFHPELVDDAVHREFVSSIG
jgi:5'-phosphate synthase pdxT subunit